MQKSRLVLKIHFVSSMNGELNEQHICKQAQQAKRCGIKVVKKSIWKENYNRQGKAESKAVLC